MAKGHYTCLDSLLDLASLRKSLVRQEDTIIFSLIERAKYPINSPLYDDQSTSNLSSSLLDFYIKESEALQAKAGRYMSPEENAFFPDNLPSPLIPPLNHTPALSRRIHYGKFVAEVKFRDAPEDYIPAIHAKDREALMKLLTFQGVEEAIMKRVEKKAKIFGQNVDVEEDDTSGEYKVDPSVVSRLFGEWVIPLTKSVQVEYLLRRLD